MVTWPGFLGAIVNEKRGRFALVTHSAPIAEAVQCLEIAERLVHLLDFDAHVSIPVNLKFYAVKMGFSSV